MKRFVYLLLLVCGTAAAFSSYGPVPGYQPALLSPDTTLAQCLGWRGKRIDPSGNYYFGARSEYDPVAGRFSSADPMGHGACKDLYSFCDGDPVNKWDPDGRFGKQIANDYQNIVDNLTEAKDIADSQITYADSNFRYADEDQENAAKFSALVDMIPAVGGIKQWVELDTGKDMFTGEYLHGNQYLQTVGIFLNFLPVAFGPASLLEGGGEAAFFGAGERGLIEEGEVEVAASEANIIRGVNFTESEAVAEEATINVADVQANGTYGRGSPTFSGSGATFQGGGTALEQSRNDLGQFMPKTAGQVAPGFNAVNDFIAQAEQNGYVVLGREVTFNTPVGNRRYDLVLQNPNTRLASAIEIKSSAAAMDRWDLEARQQFSADRWINMNGGATSIGTQNGIDIQSTYKILWEMR